MSEVGSAYVSIIPSARNFGRTLDKQTSSQVAASGKKAGSGWGKAFAIGAALVVGKKAFDFLGDAVSASSDLQESASKVGVVFGKQADQILAASKTSATAMGLSKQAYLDATGTLGNLLVSLDIAPKAAADMSTEMVKLAGDLASFNNVAPEEALLALKSGLTGETEPLKRFGVNMNDATLKAQALKMGLIENTKEALTPQTKALAAQKLIMEQTGTAQGDFARTSDGLANQQRILAAKFENVKAKIGSVLLPAVTGIVSFINKKGIPAFKDIGDRISGAWENAKNLFAAATGSEAFKSTVEAIATAAGKMKRGFKGASDALKGIDFSNLDSKQVGEFIGKAVAAGLDAIIDMAGELTSAFGKLFAKVDWIGLGIAIGKQVPALLIGLATGILNFDIGSLLQGLGDHWGEILLAVLAIAFAPAKLAGGLAKILGKIPFVGTFLSRAVTWLNELGGKLASFGGDLLKSLWKGLTAGRTPGAAIVAKIMAGFRGIPGAVKGFFDTLRIRLGVYALEGAEAAGTGLRTGFVAVVRFVASIPGKILSALGSLARLLFPKATSMVEGFLTATREKFGTVLTFVGGIPGKILRGLGNVAQLLYSAGQDIIRGLINGIKAMAGAAADAAISVVKGALDKAKDFLKIGSPSKVWEEVGMWTMRGMSDGMEKEGMKVKERLQKQLDGYLSQLSDLRSKAAALSEAVVSALTPDSFGVTATEAVAEVRDELGNITTAGVAGSTVGQNFLASLTSSVGTLKAVTAAFKKLKKVPGVSTGFLSQLLASGNTDLILAMADDKGLAKEGSKLFGQETNLATDLGQAVGMDKFGGKIDDVKAEIRELRKDLKTSGKENAERFGAVINGAAASAASRVQRVRVVV